MAKQIHITFNSDGFRQILTGSGVQTLVSDTAAEIAAKANANRTLEGDGYTSHTWMGGYGGGRWIASVNTTDINSQIDEAENKALSRAVTG